MKRVPVPSSALRSVGYDAETWTLEVEFESGAVYRYFDVDPRDVAELLSSESMGTYLNQHIKQHYAYVRVFAD